MGSVLPFTPEIQALSSFGSETTMGPETGPAIGAYALVTSERVKELNFRSSYYKGSHHDWKTFDMHGRLISGGTAIRGTQQLMSARIPEQYIPLDQRRPSVPYRLARKIVNAFTGLLFGHGRFPQFRSDDPITQDWAEAIVEAVSLPVKMIQARKIGGSCGTVGVSWCVVNGDLRIKVHKGSTVHVLEWEDEDERIPAHVVEIYTIKRTERGKTIHYYARMDWTKDADIVYQPAEAVDENDPVWLVDTEKTVEHNNGFCHFIWIDNLPDEDSNDCDGEPDYGETYDEQNNLDMINSVTVNGAILNLDPTLVLKIDPNEVKLNDQVSKGSQHALSVGPNGAATYLELAGTSITSGLTLKTDIKNEILEVCECVIADPNQVAGGNISAVALELVYAPMITKTDLLRYQYGRAILRLLEQITNAARSCYPDLSTDDVSQRYVHLPVMDENGEPVLNENGEAIEEPVEFFINLPKKIVKAPKLDDQGTPTGEFDIEQIERNPGLGRFTLEWGSYFRKTSTDHQAEATSLLAATGMRPIISQQSAVELHANSRDIDGTEEWVRVQREAAQLAEQNAQMFPEIGGETTDTTATEQSEPIGVHLDLAPTDVAKAVTIDEVRMSQGLPPVADPAFGKTMLADVGNIETELKAKELGVPNE